MTTPTPASRQVTAVNTGTDTLTATGVGLLPGGVTTGDRIRLYNVGGALPAATPGLAGVTDYFAIRVDNDNIKVATSSSDALAGTAVNITGTGTGTHFIQAGLPYCVPRVAAPLTQVFPEDDNAQWNALVALYGLLTAQAQSIWSTNIGLAGTLSVAGLIFGQNGVTAAANTHVTVSGTGKLKHGTITMSIGGAAAVATTPPSIGGSVPLFNNVVNIMIPVSLPVGAHITAIRCSITDSAGTTYQIRLVDTAGASFSGNTSAGNTTLQTLTVSSLNYNVASLIGVHVLLARAGGTGNVSVSVCEIDYDQP